METNFKATVVFSFLLLKDNETTSVMSKEKTTEVDVKLALTTLSPSTVSSAEGNKNSDEKLSSDIATSITEKPKLSHLCYKFFKNLDNIMKCVAFYKAWGFRNI